MMFRSYVALLGLFVLAPSDAAAQNSAATEGIATGYANSGLPAWLKLGGEERVRLEALGGIGFLPSNNTYLLQRLRLNLDVTPLPWLTFSFRANLAAGSPGPPSRIRPAWQPGVKPGKPARRAAKPRFWRRTVSSGSQLVQRRPHLRRAAPHPSLSQDPRGCFHRRVG
jgi:hypothetical protein